MSPDDQQRVAHEPTNARDDWAVDVRIGVMQLAGLASIGAGIIHAGVAGLHADSPTLARLFIAIAVLQVGFGLLALIRGGRLAAAATMVVNAAAATAWVWTRWWGIGWIDGLGQPEGPTFADTACAVLGAIAMVAAIAALVARRTAVHARLGLPALAVGGVAIAALLVGTGHQHSHDTLADGHGHESGDDHGAASLGLATQVTWPRAWDPALGIDLSGVPGVTPAQTDRAAALLRDTLVELPAFADVNALPALGYRSIGDERTGFEHFINYGLVADDTILDPSAPESLVFRVDGDARTLVSAMFIVGNRAVDDPELVDFGGPLMEWHTHENLCWDVTGDTPQVVGVAGPDNSCAAGIAFGGGNPMVHVWITPHECGPFAALEGHGAGQTAGDGAGRTDQCAHGDHGTHSAASSTGESPNVVAAVQSPGTMSERLAALGNGSSIDLSGTPGVSPTQQAFAERVVTSTRNRLPQWADVEAAEAAGFRSIGDAALGHEHFVNWDWINDDVFLDPDQPESLVFEPQPDGSRRLVSAMYMLPDDYTLGDVPDWGGPLMQWHIHDNLCFDTSGSTPRVGGLSSADGSCTPPLLPLNRSPMIHVWLDPNPCGPFAALEGVGAGQVIEGETARCDAQHSH